MISLFKTISIYKTLYFNFKAFPFRVAIKFPFLIGKCVVIKNVGKVILKNGKYRCHIGSQLLFNTCNRMPLIWDNRGTIIICGRIVLQPGSCIHTLDYSMIEFSGNNYVGRGSSILCHKLIKIGSNSQISWNCQLCDTDFHFIKNIPNGQVKNNCGEINIGDNVWIGNNVIIGKGVKLANDIIIGQGSIVIKSFEQSNKIVVGNPAVQKEGDYKRIWDSNMENQLSVYFTINSRNNFLFV